jgi:hypothetical protein
MFNRVSRKIGLTTAAPTPAPTNTNKFDALPGDTRRFLATLRSQAQIYRTRDATLATMLDVLHDELANGEVERVTAVTEYRALMDKRSIAEQPA